MQPGDRHFVEQDLLDLQVDQACRFSGSIFPRSGGEQFIHLRVASSLPRC
jgi:hypothetical protein